MDVLKQKKLNFLHYELYFNKPFSFESFEINKKLLILTNIPDALDDELIDIYASNLVTQEQASRHLKSKPFPNTNFIEFNEEFDMNSALNKLRE